MFRLLTSIKLLLFCLFIFCLFIFWKALLWPQQCPTAYVFHRCLHLKGHFRDKAATAGFFSNLQRHMYSKNSLKTNSQSNWNFVAWRVLTEALINGDALKERLWSVSQTSVDYWSTYWGILQSSCYSLTQVSWAPHSVNATNLWTNTAQWERMKKGETEAKERRGRRKETVKNCQICTKRKKSGLEIAFQTSGKAGVFSFCWVIFTV